MARLKFGLKSITGTAPAWLQNATAVMGLVMVAKDYIINVPGASEEAKLLASGWFDYVTDIAQAAFALAVIFTAKRKSKPATDYPLKPLHRKIPHC